MCILVMTIILIISLASCSPVNSPTITVAPTPTSGPDDVSALVAGNTAFALDLYRQLKAEDGNLFYSPYSISAALAMASAGAKENTLAQMASVSHFAPVGDQLNGLFYQLDNVLKSRSQPIEVQTYGDNGQTKKQTVDGFTLNIINALWGQKGFPFLQSYLDLVQKYYSGGMNEVDFIHAAEQARITINDWASQQTNGRIRDLLGPGDINNLTRLVLTDAIYFNAHWQHEFNENGTSSAPFTLLDGSITNVPMMHQTLTFQYTETDDCQALSLPYLGGDLDMVILLPAKDKFGEFENGLDAATLTNIMGQMTQQEVNVSLPKFSFTSNYKLSQTLKAMGMTDAFDADKADFSGMTGDKSLFVGDVIHKAFIAVDEHGTEAAAVTAVIMAMAAAPSKVYDFKADHPFIFLIRDIKTGSILFMGRVLNSAG